MTPSRPRIKEQPNGRTSDPPSAYLVAGEVGSPSTSSAATSVLLGGADRPLFFISKRLLGRPKFDITTRVVIVGGGISTYSILETLCFIPFINIMNIYVISELPGLPLRAREEAYAKAHPNKPQPQPLDTALLPTR